MPYSIETMSGDNILVDATHARMDSTFIIFFKRGEPVIEKHEERRGVWPFRYTETVEREITPEEWIVQIRTATIAQIKPIGDEELVKQAKRGATK